MPQADELKEQGIKQFMQQKYQDAAATFQQAIEAYEAQDAAGMAAEMRVNRGLALHSLGQYDAALELMHQALAVFRQMNDALRTAQALGNLGRVYAKIDNTEQAITNYREASAIFAELGDDENYGETVLAIADLQVRSGNVMQAAATYEIGLDYVKKPSTRQRLMKNLINVRNKMGGGVGAPPKSQDDEETE